MNHTISNLSIDKTKITTDRTDPSYYNRLGLFETLSGSVKNVTLESINYNNPGFNASGAGGIAGYNHGTISNVAVSGLITASGGGIVGTNSTDTVSPNPRLLGSNGGITNARSTVTIVGDSAGGIALSNWGAIKNSNYVGNLISTSYQGARIGGIFVDGNGSVDGSFSAGTITGAFVATYGSYGAGIAAIAGAGQISNSYSTMKISGFNFTAGISFSGGGNVKNSYFAGELTYVPMMINGVDYGRVYGLSRDLPVVSSYWNTQTAGDGVVQGGTGTGKTTAQMQQQSTYAGWDFVNTWVMLPGNSYPTLRNNPVRVAVVTPDPAIEAARLAAIASAAAAAAAEVDRLAAIETARVAELARQAAIVAEQARLAEVLRLARAATAAEADRLAAREAARVADIALLPEVARLAGSAAEQARLGLAEVIRLAREAAAAEAARVAAAQAAQMTTAIGYLTNIVGVVTIIRANGNRVQVGNVPEAIPMWLGDIVDATRGADSVTVTFNDGSLLQLFAGQAVELAPLQPIIGSQLQQTLAESILNDRRLWSRVLGGSGVNLGGDGIVAGVRG